MRFIKPLFFTILLGLGLFSADLVSAATYHSLAVSSNNAVTPASYAKSGDILTFTLTLQAADDSVGGTISYTIGGVAQPDASIPASPLGLTHTATALVPGGENGIVAITGITFKNTGLTNISGLPSFPFDSKIMIDTQAPTLLNIGAVSNNATNTIAKTGDSVTFTLTLAAADTWAQGNTLNYSIGAGASTPLPSAFVSTSGTTTKTAGSRSFTVVAGSNGILNIDSLNFTDKAGNALVGFLPGAPTPNLTVDTGMPVLSFTDDVAPGPVQSDDISITVTDINANTATFEYGFSADAICDATDTYGHSFTSGTPFTINTETNNQNFICAKAEDTIGNISYATSANDLNIDVTPPSITGTVQAGNGTPAWPGFVKAGNTVTYTITFNENVTVTAVNTASTAANASTLMTEVDAASASTDTLVFTVQNGDNGLVTPTVNFDITDAAGNATTITSLAPITGGSASNTLTADTITPTLTSVSIASDNANDPQWAKTGDTITLSFTASEVLKNFQTTATIAGKTATVTPGCSGSSCTSYTASITVSDTDPEGVANFTIDFEDRAGNSGTQVTATTNTSSVTIDNTAPTVPVVSIASNNGRDTTLAKTNDTITLTFTVADNLSTRASMGTPAPTILGRPATPNVTIVAAGQTLTRFTDGSETTETVVPFEFTVQDSAGNVSRLITTTTDGSQVQFDRTDPLVQSVTISAISSDNSAFTGDAPTYYAKGGDTVRVEMDVCDYVDSNSSTPTIAHTGTILGNVATFTDQGLSSGGTCTTPASGTGVFRTWRAEVTTDAGDPEGVVPFSFTIYDNTSNAASTGNEFAVTTVTDTSQVIFDKKKPTNPTDVVDLGGAETTGFKPFEQASYRWTNDTDPRGGTPVSGIQSYTVHYQNPALAIDETQTVTTRAFVPAIVIPDLTAYELRMQTTDKAGNTSPQQLLYTQKYGITATGTVTDQDTGLPISGTFVNIIAPFGSICHLPNQDICTGITDTNGKYSTVIAPNTTYKIDAIKTPNYYIAKDDLVVTTTSVNSNIQLLHVKDGDVQTGRQGTTITTDTTFVAGTKTLITQVTATSKSGDPLFTQNPDGSITVTSTGQITGVTSNNPNVVILKNTNNTFTITGAGKIQSITDTTNSASSVSSTFASGSNRVGTRKPLGGANTGFAPGISRADRVAGEFTTYEESMKFAKLLNKGFSYRVHQYVNFNGYTVFAGYQKGRLALDRMKRFSGKDYVIFRGRKTGNGRFGEFATRDLAPQQRDIKGVFQDNETEVLVQTDTGEYLLKNIKEVTQSEASENSETLVVIKPAEARVETKKMELIITDLPVGYDKKAKIYPSLYTKRNYDANYVNKFARKSYRDPAPSRIRPKHMNLISMRHRGKKVVLGDVFNNNPQRGIAKQGGDLVAKGQ